MELVDELRRQDGLTVISAMHDLTQAGQYADSMVLLVRGDQIVSGPVADVLTREHIEEHYRATVRVSVGAGGDISVSPRRPDRSKGPILVDAPSDPASEDSILRDLHTPPEEPPVRPAREQASSLVLVNTGDGKGKSTAAFGVAVRAIARDWRVCVIQFLKSGEWKAGEESVLRKLGVDWWTLGDGFTWDSENLDESQAIAGAAWASAAAKIAAGDYDVVILDEVTYPMNWGWIDSEEVLEAIRSRPIHVNVVATGRDAPDTLLELADTATHMVNVHHAYDRGIAARRGIDF
jgi:cob(I)alamin adenosyltransferase